MLIFMKGSMAKNAPLDVSDGCLVTGEGINKKTSEFHVVIEPMTSITLVMHLILTWNSEIFSVVPSPVAKQPSFTKC